MSLFVRCAAAACLLSTAFLACSSDDRNSFETEDPPPLVETTDAAPAPSATCEGRRCSRDLHKVLDGCTDAILEECPSDRGCGDGVCTTPCDAASKAQGSIGCSFWTIPPDAPVNDDTSCFAAFVANTWSTPATVNASFGGEPLDISKSVYRAVPAGTALRYERIEGPIPPGEVGVVFLSEGPPTPEKVYCPPGVTVAYPDLVVAKHATSIYKAFQLATDVPVSAYSIFPYGGASSAITAATLLLPTHSWGTNYLLVDGYEKTVDPQFVQIIAEEDDTVVRIKPRVDVREGYGVAAAARDVVGSWTLSRGQVLEFRQDGLAGSPLESSHPVALFGGTVCAFIPAQVAACDTLHQQIPPIKQWGSSYSAVPYKSRRAGIQETDPIPEVVIWRIGGARDGTVLTYEPSRPNRAPLTLSSGELSFFETDQPFIVRSQGSDFPIYLATYMSGTSRYRTLGDPDFVNIVPDAQFLDNYVFFVDYTYPTSTLTVVRRNDGKGFHDVSVDCAGVLSGWHPLGPTGTVEYTWLDVTNLGNPVTTASGTCSYGRHEASSDGPFGLYVWGMGSSVSYGFPAGAGSRPVSPYSIEVR